MNGIHDMGGLQDMGPLQYENDEPVFHAAWERRIFAINNSLRGIGKWNLDEWRHQIELIPPAEYLRMSYYERWVLINEQLLVKNRMVALAELVSGTRATAAETDAQALIDTAEAPTHSGNDRDETARFLAGQLVRARNINPLGHTRLPRYARGKVGVIVRDHGVSSFPDTNAHHQGQKRQHVYSVRFPARELWGEAAPVQDSVYLDMWDDYLEYA